MTFWILLAIAAFLTYISFKWRNILLSLGAMISWFVLWRYNNDFSPTNIVQGDITHTWMTYTFLVLAIAVMFMFFRNRAKDYTGYPRSVDEEREYQDKLKAPKQASSFADESNTEYKRRVRRAVRRK